MATIRTERIRATDKQMQELMQSVRNMGYGSYQYHAGTKIVSVVNYIGYSTAIGPGGHAIQLQSPYSFSAIVCTYPNVKKNYMYVNRVHSEDGDNRFHDDGLEYKLGGSVEKLGV